MAWAAIPRTRAAVDSFSPSRGSRVSSYTSTWGQPSDWKRMVLVPMGAAKARN